LSDEVNDNQGQYAPETFDNLKRFIDDAIAARIEHINNADLERLDRFRLDAQKHREAYKLHFDNKPDPTMTDELLDWHDKSKELQGKALNFERQHAILKDKLELGNEDAIKRQARRHVSEQHPDKYQAYQKSKRLQTANKLVEEWSTLDTKLDNLIESGGPSRDIANTAHKLNAVLNRLEKSEEFKESASDKSRQSIQQSKDKIQKAIENDRDSGLEL